MSHPLLGTSRRTTCAKRGARTANTNFCDTCRADYNKKRRKKRQEWKEEGRCMACGKVILQVNPRTSELFLTCIGCRRRKSNRYYQRKAH